MGVDTNMQQQTDLTNPQWPFTPGVVNFRNQLKDKKLNGPKVHQSLSLHAKFRNMEEK